MNILNVNLINIKHIKERIYGESTDAITFDFSDLERLMTKSLRFGKLISRKGAELGHMLLLNINGECKDIFNHICNHI